MNNFRNYILLFASCATLSASGASDYAKERCEQAKTSAQVFSKSLMDFKGEGSEENLASLEATVQKAKALESVYRTLDKLKDDRESFYNRLNPSHENSFFSSNKGIKEDFEAVQKQIIGNQVLSVVSSSISSFLEEDSPLFEGKMREVLTNKQKDKFLGSLNVYQEIHDECKKQADKLNAVQKANCDVFTKEDNRLFRHSSQDFVQDVTNNFFKAIFTASISEDPETADKELSQEEVKKALIEVQNNSIIKKVDISELENENHSLLGAIDNLDKLNHFEGMTFNDESSNSLTAKMASNPSSTQDSQFSISKFKKMDEDYKNFKDCFAKNSFTGKDIDSCGSTKTKEAFKGFLGQMDQFSKTETAKAAQSDAIFDNLVEKSKEDFKDFNKNLFQDPSTLSALKQLELLTGKKDGLGEALTKFCGESAKDLTISSLNKQDSVEEKSVLFECISKLNKDNSIQSLKDSLADAKKAQEKIDKIKESKEYKETNDLLKYSSFLANKECARAKENTGTLVKCGPNDNSFTALILGENQEILTNINDLDWKLQGQDKAQEYLSPLSAMCGKINRTLKEQEKAIESGAQTTPVTEVDKEKEAICKHVEKDYSSVLASKPSPAQKEAQKKYTFKYNASTGEMDRKERRSIATKIGTSAAKSALNHGVPMFFSNIQFKNSLPYTTDQAIWKKNQLYFLNNPEYMFPNSYFTGYGLTGSPSYYGAPSYYGF